MARRGKSPIGISTPAVAPSVPALNTLTLAPASVDPLDLNGTDERELVCTAQDQAGSPFAVPVLTAHTTNDSYVTAAVVGDVLTITAVAAGGSAEVYVTGGGKESNHVAVSVVVDGAFSIEISPSETINTNVDNAPIQFTAVVRDVNDVVIDVPVEWTAIGDGGTIDEDGLFTFDGVINEDGLPISANIGATLSSLETLIFIAVGEAASVLVAPSTLDLFDGPPPDNVGQLTATVLDQFGNDTLQTVGGSWLSDDEDIATVDVDGEVTYVGVGDCTVYVEYDAGDPGILESNHCAVNCSLS